MLLNSTWMLWISSYLFFLLENQSKMPKEKHQNLKIVQSTRVRSSDNIFHLWSMKWGQNSISSFDEFWSFAIQRNTNCEGKTFSFVSIERLNAIASAVEMYLHLNDLLKLLIAFLKSQYICIESIFFSAGRVVRSNIYTHFHFCRKTFHKHIDNTHTYTHQLKKHLIHPHDFMIIFKLVQQSSVPALPKA